MASEQSLPPPTAWAQRRNLVSLSINVEDCKEPVIKIEPTQVYFRGSGGPDKKNYEITIDLYGEINPEESKQFVRDRSIDLFLKKKEEGPYWPALLKDKKKVHWLKIDFNRWRDEDDSEPEEGAGGGEEDLDEMMRRMGGLNSAAGQADLNDLEGSDEDDEDIPDLE